MFGPGPNMMTMTGPMTPHGKTLLNRNLSQMNLPPEEWAAEVRDLNGQLVECLEQLYEREQELEEQHVAIEGLENTLVKSKQQMAALYYDFAKRCEAWELREKQYKEQSRDIHNTNDDLQLRLKRTQEMLDALKKENKDSLDAKIIELNRKVANPLISMSSLPLFPSLSLSLSLCLSLSHSLAHTPTYPCTPSHTYLRTISHSYLRTH